ncbi:MAG TPA: hypothetical protein VGQ82_07700, partial [Chthoniobacterales bacterium]|nr:hypothetical protein [Chthoniobacterales bacterium]
SIHALAAQLVFVGWFHIRISFEMQVVPVLDSKVCVWRRSLLQTACHAFEIIHKCLTGSFLR